VKLPYRAPSHLSHSSADTQEPLSPRLTSSLDLSGCQIRAIINHSLTQGTYLGSSSGSSKDINLTNLIF